MRKIIWVVLLVVIMAIAAIVLSVLLAYGSRYDDEAVEKFFNELKDDGWELVLNSGARYIFKRKIR
jgi:hypothetical protein